MSKTISKIQCFESCPLKYKMIYIDKLEQESSEAFEKGSSIHAILENFEYFEIVKNFFDSDIGKTFYPIIKDGEKEKQIGLKIQNKNLVSCSFNDKDCLIRGVIDVVNSNNIIDYKTGKYIDENNQKWLQLEFYALWLFASTDYTEVNVSYIYLEHNKVNTKTIYKDNVKDIIKNIFSRINNVIKYEKNPTDTYNITSLCDYCGVKKYCSHYAEHLKVHKLMTEEIKEIDLSI